MKILATIVTTIGALVAGVMMLGALLYVVDAGDGSGIAATIIDIGRFLAEPFRFIFVFDNNDTQLPLNWGIGAAVYLVSALALAHAARTAGELWGRREHHATTPHATA